MVGVKEQPRKGLPKRPQLLLLGLGYGCYLSFFPIGPLGTVFLTQLATGWDGILLSRVLFELATAGAILAWKLAGAGPAAQRPATTRLSFACALLLTCLVPTLAPLAPPQAAAPLYWTMMGVFTAAPKLFWYELFFRLYRSRGRSKLLVCLAGSFFVAAAVMPLSSLITQALGTAPSVALTVTLCWACLELGKRDETGAVPQPVLSSAYSSSTYIKIVTASFGVSWAFSYTIAVNSGFGTESGATNSGVMLAGITLCSLLMLLFSRSRLADTLRFNEMMRWVIVAVASAWAVMPLASDAAPALACFLCSAAYIFQSVLMILLIVEICDDYRVSVACVTAVHYGRFIVFASLSSLSYWLLSQACAPKIALEAVTAICVVATVACVPILPSRKSRAMVLAMDGLPEEKSRADLLRESMETLARTRGLTAREAEVMAMLVKGMGRADIAESLHVSTWTVKNHVANIYAKTDVHSAQELISRLEHGHTAG